MRKRILLSFPWAVVLLTLGLLALFLTACSGSNSAQARPGAESTSMLNPAPTSTPRPNREGGAEGATPLPSVATMTVSNLETPAPEGTVSQPVGPAASSGTATSEDALPEGVAISSEQIVAAFEDVLHGIYEEALRSVVYIRVANPVSDSLRTIPGIPDDILWGAGSGFVWDSEGHIVTNHHVVETSTGVSGEVTVIFADSSEAKATVVGSDPHSDLAVIKLEGGDWNLQPAPLGDSSQVRVGQLSVAIGAPFGQEFTMTSGIVSAIGRSIRGQGQFTIPEVIQTDSAINPGNSGGPLLDRLGRVIGINTQIVSNTGNFSGVGMAVPVNIARRVVPSLIDNGEFNYPWLGVSIRTVSTAYADEIDLPEGTRGAVVASTVGGSPADKAGLRGSESTVKINGVDYPSGGDIIVAVGGYEVAGSSELIAHLTYNYSPGDAVIFSVLRDGQAEEIEVTLGQRPELQE